MNAVYFLSVAMGVFAIWLSGTVLMAIMMVANVPFILVFVLALFYNIEAGRLLFRYLDKKNGPDNPVKIDKD